MAEKYLKSSLEQEKKRFETVSEQQAEHNPPLFLNNQLRGPCTPSGHMTYDMQTLWIENANVRAKYRAMEKDHDRVKSQNCSLTDQYDVQKNNSIIANNQEAIVKLQSTVYELKACQSKDETREKGLEDAKKLQVAAESQ